MALRTPAAAVSLSAKIGAWDFTGDGTRDFYGTVPSFALSCTLFDGYTCNLDISTGLAFTVIRYDSRRHYFYLLPLQLSFLVRLLREPSLLAPYLGAGAGGYYKIDRSPTARKTYHFVTYGYHFMIGTHINLSDSISLVVEIKYCFCMTNVMEEINISGLNPSAGVCYRFGR
ncbi:MAG: hypothetical protein JXA20_10780 [Spirochaetes bacterium]|nr:hypothetical protein [Spirochaetota bacterium]